MRLLISTLAEKVPASRCCWVALLLGCLSLAGCTSLEQLRGDKFPEDENTRLCEKLRPRDKNNDSLFFFSNKAHQIDRHLGAE